MHMQRYCIHHTRNLRLSPDHTFPSKFCVIDFQCKQTMDRLVHAGRPPWEWDPINLPSRCAIRDLDLASTTSERLARTSAT